MLLGVLSVKRGVRSDFMRFLIDDIILLDGIMGSPQQ
jgi:hypothetical protein